MTSNVFSRLIKEDHLESKFARPVKKINLNKRKIEDVIDLENDLVNIAPPIRRPRWSGRRVNNFVKPGVSFVYNSLPKTVVKRAFDEVYTDANIVEQALNRENEFYYGKRPYVTLLDESNPTPSMVAVTPQIPVNSAATTVNGMQAQPTVQIMTKPITSESSENMEVETVTVRPTKQVAPGVGVQTVDVDVPVVHEASTQTVLPPRFVSYKRRIPTAYYHPSIQLGGITTTKKRKRRRRRRTKRSTWREKIYYRNLIPSVTYHPSIIA